MAKLPVEIRIHIFGYVALETSSITIRSTDHCRPLWPKSRPRRLWSMSHGHSRKHWLQLICTCKQLYAEGRPVYFSVNCWDFSLPTYSFDGETRAWHVRLQDWLEEVPRDHVKDMRHITISAYDTISSDTAGDTSLPENGLAMFYNGFCKVVAVFSCSNPRFSCYLGMIEYPVFETSLADGAGLEVITSSSGLAYQLYLPMWSISALEGRLAEFEDEAQAKFVQARKLVQASPLDFRYREVLLTFEQEYEDARKVLAEVVPRIKQNVRSGAHGKLVSGG